MDLTRPERAESNGVWGIRLLFDTGYEVRDGSLSLTAHRFPKDRWPGCSAARAILPEMSVLGTRSRKKVVRTCLPASRGSR